jgi:hypothetical protein
VSNNVAVAATDGITDASPGGATASVPPGRRWNVLISHLVKAYLLCVVIALVVKLAYGQFA